MDFKCRNFNNYVFFGVKKRFTPFWSSHHMGIHILRVDEIGKIMSEDLFLRKAENFP